MNVIPNNSRFLFATFAAVCAINRLTGAGYQVLQVRIEGRNPRIRIVAPPPGQIEAGVKIAGHRNGRPYWLRAAHLQGCQVEWDEAADDTEGAPTPPEPTAHRSYLV